MASNVDIYVMNVDPASIVWGAHPYLTQNQRERDLQLGDTFTSCYDIKKNTHDEMLSGIPPDCTPLNVQPIYLTIVKMEERMGGHIRWLESLSAASGRYAGLHLVGTGLEHVTTGRCLRTDGAMK
ncbi:MAG: hypothetical protein EOP77_00755 [Variovorax sp.]|nr:MAG: hypothetical protein EOP77_00755 [Variovorax sp.]